MSDNVSAAATGLPAMMGRPVRRMLEDEIDRLIAMLDELDGDADFEPDDDDEPSLGWAASGATGSIDDREEDCEDEGAPSGDDEPTLGWTRSHQFGALGPHVDDCEIVCEDEGDPDWGCGDRDGLAEQAPHGCEAML